MLTQIASTITPIVLLTLLLLFHYCRPALGFAAMNRRRPVESQAARPTRGKDDDEDRRPRPICGEPLDTAAIPPTRPDKDEDDEDRCPEDATTITLAARSHSFDLQLPITLAAAIPPAREPEDDDDGARHHSTKRGSDFALLATPIRPDKNPDEEDRAPIYGPEHDDEAGEAHMKAQAAGPFFPCEDEDEDEDEDITVVTQARPVFDPESDEDDEDGSKMAARELAVRNSWRYVRRYHPGIYGDQRIAPVAARASLFKAATSSSPTWTDEKDIEEDHHPALRCGRRPLPAQRGNVSFFLPGRFERAARRASSLHPWSSIDPTFISADMTVVEEDQEDLTDWTNLNGDDLQIEDDTDGDTIAAAGCYRGMREQRGGAFVLPLLGDEDDRGGTGWIMIRSGARGPQLPDDDDGNGQLAPLPTFPRKPAPNAAAILVARQAQQLQEEAATWS
jgi:hypothetical protein